LPKKKDKADKVDKVDKVDKTAEEELLQVLTDELVAGLMVPPPLPQSEDPKIRTIGIIGDIDEEKTSDTIYGMLILNETSKKEVLVDTDKPELGTKTERSPFELLISTYGGSASEMFGIYDTMRKIKEGCTISTRGVGKVMSAGVLLLAAGTKGSRKIGENCRVMIHDIKGGTVGDVSDLENEFNEIKWTQDTYVKLLARETDMTEKYIRNLIKKKVNVYLSAEEAVDLGIADDVF